MMRHTILSYCSGPAHQHLLAAVDLALAEDGQDLTSCAVFAPEDRLHAVIIAKQHTLLAGIDIIPLVMDRCGATAYTWQALQHDGDTLAPGTTAATITGSARHVLQAERVILNMITHLSGIANQTRRYADALSGSATRLLDTRKTLPGLRYPDKYAVLVGGGHNHRRNLEEMLMLKDNHIDAAGSITLAVARLRAAYAPCPPIEVECRTEAEVREAVACNVDRIMLDNMNLDEMAAALTLVPPHIETEASGGVTLESIAHIARITPKAPDFISVGRLTHSAPAADFSMRISREKA